MNFIEAEYHVCIATCRSGDFDSYIAAAENAIKYLFAVDLHHHSKLIPVHIHEMKIITATDFELLVFLSITAAYRSVPYFLIGT